jgi:hypothetical protein
LEQGAALVGHTNTDLYSKAAIITQVFTADNVQLTQCVDVTCTPSPTVMVVQNVRSEEVSYCHELHIEVWKASRRQQKHSEAAANA